MSNEKIRVHRVGAVTAGCTMIIYGVLFVLKSFFNIITYEAMFRLWPLILIGLGIEILISVINERKMVYDKGAVFLLLMMAVFAMGMAGVDLLIHYDGVIHLGNGI